MTNSPLSPASTLLESDRVGESWFYIDSVPKTMEVKNGKGFDMEKFTIGKVAKAADVGVETIRFYEKKGLIVQPQATGTYREYPQSVVTRIRFIKRAKELGFKLSEIRDLLELADQPEEDRAAVKQIAEAKVESIRTRICELRKAEEILADLVDQCTGEGRIHDCPIIEAFANDDFRSNKRHS